MGFEVIYNKKRAHPAFGCALFLFVKILLFVEHGVDFLGALPQAFDYSSLSIFMISQQALATLVPGPKMAATPAL